MNQGQYYLNSQGPCQIFFFLLMHPPPSPMNRLKKPSRPPFSQVLGQHWGQCISFTSSLDSKLVYFWFCLTSRCVCEIINCSSKIASCTNNKGHNTFTSANKIHFFYFSFYPSMLCMFYSILILHLNKCVISICFSLGSTEIIVLQSCSAMKTLIIWV